MTEVVTLVVLAWSLPGFGLIALGYVAVVIGVPLVLSLVVWFAICLGLWARARR